MNLRPMTDVEKRAAAKAFAKAWTGRGDEKQDAQNFWRMLLSNVYGMVSPDARSAQIQRAVGSSAHTGEAADGDRYTVCRSGRKCENMTILSYQESVAC